MQKNLFLFLLVALITQRLSAQEIHYSDNTPIEERRLPLQHAMGGSAEDIYDEIEYIPLETSKESTIQRIAKMWLSDQHYIVFDDFGGQIVFFDKQGKYIRKINEIPNCNNCKIGNQLFSDVSMDFDNGFIYARTIIQIEKCFWVKYDFKGNYLGVQPQFNDMNEFTFWRNSLFSYTSPRYLQDKKLKMLSIHKDGIEKSIITYDSLASVNSDEYLDNNRVFSDASPKDSLLYFTRSYDYNIYELNEKGLKKVYKFIFPLQYSIPPNFITNKEYNGKRDKLLKEENKSWIRGINFIRRHQDYLIFKASSFNTSRSSEFAYNLSTGFLLNLEKVTPNNFNNNFSLGDNLNEFIIASDDQYLYKSVMPSELLKTTKEDGFNYTNDPDGKTHKMISNLTKFSNPILVRLKIKADL